MGNSSYFEIIFVTIQKSEDISKCRKMKGIVCLLACLVLLGTGTDAINRNERNILRARGENVGEGSHEFDIDEFDVDQETCEGKGWGEHIDSWDIVAHSLDDAECGKYVAHMKCLCQAIFSLGAIMKDPQFTCIRCNDNPANPE